MHAFAFRAAVHAAFLSFAFIGVGPLAAQPLVRETPTTLVLTTPGTGPGGGGAGGGGGAVGTILPPTLSATGAFTDLIRLTPARGLVPYEPNAVLWSDYAKKTRWFGLNSATTMMGFQRDARWTIPIGAFWVKHFDLEMRRGDPTSLRRVETRFLVRSPGDVEGRVTGYSYRWNDAQTDATLVPMEGATQVFQITENGVTRAQTWTFPGRLDCQTCHNSVGGPILSFSTRQMNRPWRDGTNQIVALARAGYLDVTSVPDPATLPALVDHSDITQPLELRARSYLDVNCAQCHRPGIAAAGAFDLLLNPGAFDTRATTPLSLTGMIDGALKAAGADASQRVVAPGDPTRSQLLARMATRGTSRMPPLATGERDLAGEALVNEWIKALAQPQSPSRLLNLSARAVAGTGGSTLITGFVIAPGAPRAVLVRAVGPTLARFGVSGVSQAPSVTVFDANARPVGANARWNLAANAADLRTTAARVGAFALTEDSNDSALLLTLSPGAYSAHAVDNTSGIALVEIYDAENSSLSALINASVRASVGSGAAVVIPGLVVGSGAAKTVLVRAVGPGLAAFGVSGTLSAPVVTLLAGGETYLTNTRWNSAANATDIRSAATQVGAFALAEGSADSALLVSLSPGAYTLQVNGAGAASGNVLVEIYEVR